MWLWKVVGKGGGGSRLAIGGAVGLHCRGSRRLHEASPRLSESTLRVACLYISADLDLDQLKPHVTS